MRMVVDTNYLTSPKLRDYLSEPSNFAVLSDYVFIEALQGDSPTSILKTMTILAEHPKQVIVTKGIEALCILKTRRRSRGLQRRLIDRNETSGFSAWCKNLKGAAAGDQARERQLQEMRQHAAAHLNFMLWNMETYAANLKEHEKKYTQAELTILRTGQPYTPELTNKLVDNILDLAEAFSAAHGAPKPPLLRLPNAYIFRFAICAHILTLKRIANGGAPGGNPANFRNDSIDASFAAFATYFDGLLTEDAKPIDVHRNARFLVKYFFTQIRNESARPA